MKRILVLTDFSELASYAKKLADSVSVAINGELHLLKIVNIPSDISIGSHGEPISGMAGEVSSFVVERDESVSKMEEWKQDLKSDVFTEVKYGNILKETEQYIKDHQIDLVVMGTHGVDGLKELISGSVTEHVIKGNSVPVLSLKCDRSDLDFSNFLVTGDFKNQRSDDLEVVRLMQKTFNSTIHLLSVNTKSDFFTTIEAEQRMNQFAEINDLKNVVFHTYSDESFEAGIENFANSFELNENGHIGIVAVQKKHHSQLGYWIHGCEATRIVNHVFRPILTYCND